MSRFNFNSSAAVWRQVYTGNKSVLTNQSKAYDGFFSPIDNDANTSALSIMGQAYQFVTDGDSDIKAGDSLIIDSETYQVRGTKRDNMKRNDILTCIMELSVKE